MPPAARFGASKFRNAVLHVPGRETWYRGDLPSGGSSSSSASATSTFSFEIKANREWIVVLSQGGDLSYRRYDSEGTGGTKGTAKVGQVGDWDLSRLEGGHLAVGAVDGAVTIYQLPTGEGAGSQLQSVHTIPSSGSAVTSVAFHPTTPDVLLVSTAAGALDIYDLTSDASSTAALSLSGKEPKGYWSAAWSPDGRRVAAVGKSGTCYIWDPRAGSDPVGSRSLMIQAIKPARVSWVGTDELFLTAFSKTRQREYSLLSASDRMATVFTQSLDTSTAPLLSTIDQERRIVYITARGDMTIRQVELSGATGFQETVHPLQLAVATAGIALASPTVLPVMQAVIAQVLVQAVDKDGDALVPLEIKVPRRQLIDYHDDLYPDVVSTVPEQTAKEWFDGADKAPLPISLDPSRRSGWENELKARAARSQHSPQGPGQTSEVPSAASSGPATSQPEQVAADSIASTKPIPAGVEAPPVPSGQDPSPSSSTTPDHSLPPLKDGETYSSTSYKVRLMSEHVARQVEQYRSQGRKDPLIAGLQGPQGCGKTTLCSDLVSSLEAKGLKAAVLSLDDLYLTNAGLKAIARKHPNNTLLSGRGPPGTHDQELSVSVLKGVKALNDQPGTTVSLPIFDKSLCGGEGDRSAETIPLSGPLDVFVLEGWSTGFAPLDEDELFERYAAAKNAEGPAPYFVAHPLTSLTELNDYLAAFSAAVYPFLSTLIAIEPTTYEHVFRWRLEQEHAMKAKNGGRGMSDDEVRRFVERYMPGYELFRSGMWAPERPWSGKGLKLVYGSQREVLRIEGGSEGSEDKGSAAAAAGDNGARAVPAGAKGEAAEPLQKSQIEAKPGGQTAAPNPAPPASQASSAAQPSKTQTAPTQGKEPFNPGWSRKFLGGKAPLISSYDSLPALNTLHPDSLILKATPELAFFPIQGTGGRLAVHPLSKKGRMKVGGEGYLSAGVEIVDFAVEPFKADDGVRVAVAGEDGAIRVWIAGPDGVDGAGPEPRAVLKGTGIEKISQVEFHPTARDLLVVSSNDHGFSSLRFFDLPTGKDSLVVPLDGKGLFNFTFSPSGDRVALATKDGEIRVLDARRAADSLVAGKAHDSPRSFQVSWVDDKHLVSVGFSRGSQRKINLYRIDDADKAIKTIASQLIDTSPSVLFPHYDPDTSILYIWGKGERVINAYEIKPSAPTDPIFKLPAYTSGEAQLGVWWQPKRTVDVKKVEVGKVLRLTAKTMEEVSFSVPRNKPDFFQDDIYVDTLDVEAPSCSAAEWLGGASPPLQRISLRPAGMKPLSEAPKTTTSAKAKFVPAQDVLSEQQKKKQEMDALFAKAKADESSDEDEPPVKGLPPPDDDW